ncbi:MAG: chromate transporter [Bacteroidaceae bacterium]
MIFLQLFYTFFKIGLFGFGGGYAMLSLIHGDVVTAQHWLTPAEFTDIVAISQMTPGPIAVNAATYVGYTSVVNAGYSTSLGIAGSALATLGVVLPSFFMMFFVSRFLLAHRDNYIVNHIFSLLRPIVIGLIGAAALLLMNAENFSAPSICPWQFYISIFLFAAAYIGTQHFRVNPIFMICLCGFAGWLIY